MNRDERLPTTRRPNANGHEVGRLHFLNSETETRRGKWVKNMHGNLNRYK